LLANTRRSRSTRFEQGGDSVWLAAAARGRYAAELARYIERETVPGSALVGRRYQAPLALSSGERRVVAAEWVSADDGTGVVHLAPAYSEDDQATCAALGITGANPVRDDGTFDDRAGAFAGLHVFAASEPIAQALARTGGPRSSPGSHATGPSRR
jgi:isoleucyl-tRNA synthetase